MFKKYLFSELFIISVGIWKSDILWFEDSFLGAEDHWRVFPQKESSIEPLCCRAHNSPASFSVTRITSSLHIGRLGSCQIRVKLWPLGVCGVSCHQSVCLSEIKTRWNRQRFVFSGRLTGEQASAGRNENKLLMLSEQFHSGRVLFALFKGFRISRSSWRTVASCLLDLW